LEIDELDACSVGEVTQWVRIRSRDANNPVWLPGHSAQHYFDMLHAPSKERVWFEKSAHVPHLEEPQAFKEPLQKVRRATLGLATRKTPTDTPSAAAVHHPIATTSTNRVARASET
jgi:hypothetical protein